MAISHAECDHPSTPAARKICRDWRKTNGGEVPAIVAEKWSAERALAEGAGLVPKTPRVRKPRAKKERVRPRVLELSKGEVAEGFLINPEEHGQMARSFTHHIVPSTWLEDMPEPFSRAAKRFMAFGWPVTWWPPVRPSVRSERVEQKVVVDGPKGHITLCWNVDDHTETSISFRSWLHSVHYGQLDMKEAVRRARG